MYIGGNETKTIVNLPYKRDSEVELIHKNLDFTQKTSVVNPEKKESK